VSSYLNSLVLIVATVPEQALVDEGGAGPLPAVMEAFARPTRIVRGKGVDAAWRVDTAKFEMEEERALYAAYEQASAGVTPSMGVRDFLQVLLPPDGCNSLFGWHAPSLSAAWWWDAQTCDVTF
jgi:hypothetical protein